jgi:arylsulfatase A-like enzyme
MVTRLDGNVGRLVETLKALDLTRDTLIVFTSDHGATFESGNLGTSSALDSNRPFRGQKRTLWEGGVRVPAFAYWPGRIAPGVSEHEVIHLTDVFPTLVAAAGGKVDPSWHIDGTDLLAAWTGKAGVPDRTLFWEWRSEGASQVAALAGPFKLVITGGSKPELFDVETDPVERLDVAAQHPELTRRLRTELSAWLATETRR